MCYSGYAVGSQEHSVTALIAKEQGEGLVTGVDGLWLQRFISERWYGAANAEILQDTLKDIDSRITLGVGWGRSLLTAPAKPWRQPQLKCCARGH